MAALVRVPVRLQGLADQPARLGRIRHRRRVQLLDAERCRHREISRSPTPRPCRPAHCSARSSPTGRKRSRSAAPAVDGNRRSRAPAAAHPATLAGAGQPEGISALDDQSVGVGDVRPVSRWWVQTRMSCSRSEPLRSGLQQVLKSARAAYRASGTSSRGRRPRPSGLTVVHVERLPSLATPGAAPRRLLSSCGPAWSLVALLGGGRHLAEVSRKPSPAIRRIRVALMVGTSTWVRSDLMCSLCSTPNAAPRQYQAQILQRTDCSRWVPITCPPAVSDRRSRRGTRRR